MTEVLPTLLPKSGGLEYANEIEVSVGNTLNIYLFIYFFFFLLIIIFPLDKSFANTFVYAIQICKWGEMTEVLPTLLPKSGGLEYANEIEVSVGNTLNIYLFIYFFFFLLIIIFPLDKSFANTFVYAIQICKWGEMTEVLPTLLPKSGATFPAKSPVKPPPL
jgi:antitoxin component of MazEF toxin-antitoxin module